VKVVLELAHALAARGHDVTLFSFAARPEWYELRLPLLATHDFGEIDMRAFDFVVVSNSFMVPMLLPFVAPARPLYFAQDFDAYHYGSGSSRYEDFVSPKETTAEIYRLPTPILASSTSVAELMRGIGRDVPSIEIAIDKSVFTPQPPHARGERDRVLMVGNYLQLFKGMADGLEALRIVNETRPVELVLATQESRNREAFERYPFPIEIHHQPHEREMPAIYASADLYCGASWYEGLGLPPLEAFACGVPVVCTRNFGVTEYGIDEYNLLLSAPNDPADLAAKILRALTDEPLRQRLRQNGFDTLQDRYEWPRTAASFEHQLEIIDRQYPAPPAVDHDAMRELLADLERAGNLTPIDVFRRYHDVATRVESHLGELETNAGDRALLNDLRAASEELRPFLVNERAQYHRAFRSLFDLCQSVIATDGDPRVVALMRRRVGLKQ
jgi:glycosyltransferase involved in cell wall biosynthesis